METINIVIPVQYKESLVTCSQEYINQLDIVEELKMTLLTVGLPMNSNYFIYADNPITFNHEPEVKRNKYTNKDYLFIGQLNEIGELVVECRSGIVYQLFNDQTEPSFVNSNLNMFLDCLGCWQSFYPARMEFVNEGEKQEEFFSLFDHPEVYLKIRDKIAVIDPNALSSEHNFWSRWCQPDVV